MKVEHIKFKGKRLDNGKWVEGDLLHSYEGSVIIITIDSDRAFSADPSSVCQFTGLKDKNGKEIFEGDILAHDGKIIGHIVGGVRGYCYDVIYKNPRYDPSWSLYGTVVNDYKGNVEVVGNVIDNHDLLIS